MNLISYHRLSEAIYFNIDISKSQTVTGIQNTISLRVFFSGH